MGLQRQNSDQKVYAIVGDGELNEGPIWEGALISSHHKLNNLMLIVDKNVFQAMGETDDILAMGDLSEKFISFGFEALEIDGHNEIEISSAIKKLWASKNNKPKALIAKTIKGKGVPFMESDNRRHYTRLDSQTFADAIKVLDMTEVSK